MSGYREKPIGIFDSGIGGLSVADAIIKRLPAEQILYFGDTAHIPYGTRAADEVRQFSENITAFLLSEGCKLIVLACNTASAAALNHLRHRWPDVPIVGMEPAVKPGARATRSGKVGVLATAGTFQSQRYASLMARFAKDVQLLENPCLGLVERIEAGKTDSPETEQLLTAILQPMLDAGADTFVLGCTHYPFVQPLIERIIGPENTVINPAPAVARQVERLLQERGWLSPELQRPHRFFVSGKKESFEGMARRALGIAIAAEAGLLL